jgi:hypothetical protein
MRKVLSVAILCSLVVLFPLVSWSIPINRTEENRRQYPLLDLLTDSLDQRQIDTLFDYAPPNAQTIRAGDRPRLAPLDNFPIGNLGVYDWVSPTETDLIGWQQAYQRAEHQAIIAVDTGNPEAGSESPTLREFRAAWEQAPLARRIFISFTAANEAQARVIKEQLTARGFLVFTYRENMANVTTLADVFHFFAGAGNRFVIDSPEARQSVGVQIEARFHELLLQTEQRGRVVEVPADHKEQRARRARKVARWLDPYLAQLERQELLLEERIASQPDKPDAGLVKDRQEAQQRVEATLDLRRTIMTEPRKPKDPPDESALARRPSGPRTPPSLPGWTRRPDLHTPPPPPDTPSTGNYLQRIKKNPPRFDVEKPTIVIDIEGHAGSYIFDAVTMTELWSAYHLLRPTEAQTRHGAKPGDAGICGIERNNPDGSWDFVLHPAVANTLLAREAMRLDMVLALDHRSLPPVPSGWGTYRWFDTPAVILAEKGTIYVKAPSEPHFTLMRVHLWSMKAKTSDLLPIDTRAAVAVSMRSGISTALPACLLC